MISVFMSLLTLSEVLEARLSLCARTAGVHWCELAQQSQAQQDYFFLKTAIFNFYKFTVSRGDTFPQQNLPINLM